jgi:predicted naringenin-chalcone synthase
MPAIRMGEGFISAMKNRNMNTSLTQVDIVHTEICSLHMNPLVHSPEQIVVQTLFADGHIKYSLVPSGTAKCGLAILNIKEQVIQDSGDDMSWIPETWGMQMTLSRDVPKKIAANLKQFLDKLVAPTKLLTAEVLLKATFAIHPGGPKIIEAVQKAFELQDAQLEKSKEVLFHHGNMSSATLPHVWKVILEEGLSPGHIVVSLAFGPGLTLFGAVFRII